MTSKKNGSKKLFENMPVEPEDVPQENSEGTESALAKLPVEESNSSDASADQVATGESTPPAEPEELSPDDLLEDVRRSLIEEQQEHDKEARSKWWQRIG